MRYYGRRKELRQFSDFVQNLVTFSGFKLKFDLVQKLLQD